MTWLIGLFTSPARAEAIVGDLTEGFRERSPRVGRRAARRWFWWQGVRSAWHLAVGQLRHEPWTVAGWAFVLLVAFNLVEIPTELGARFLVA